MRKIAIFVEGQTELLFIDRLVHELAQKTGLVTEHAEASGGATRARNIRMLKRVTLHATHRYYVLIVNCGGDSKVKSDILERYHNLTAAGFSRILGLRDVYGQFRYEDIQRLRGAMRHGLPRNVEIILSVMEIEAWFLAEYTHFIRIDVRLSPEFIEKKLRFNPALDDLERRWHPAEDLDRIYHLVGWRYTKQKSNLERTLDRINLDFFITDVTKRFQDAGWLVEILKDEFDFSSQDTKAESGGAFAHGVL